MPTLDEVTTKSVEKVWTSPDGQRNIYKLTLNYKGSTLPVQTYSDAIAVVGWTGEVESYEKPGKFGPQTFVKQPQKEGYSGGRSSGGGGGSGYSKAPADPFTMYLSYAKDVAVALVAKTGKLDADEYKAVLDLVIAGGHSLFEGRPGNEEKPDVVAEVTDSAMESVDKLFDDDEEEKPWPKK